MKSFLPLLWILLFALAAALLWALASGRAARAILAIRILDDLRRPGSPSLLTRATAPPRVSALRLQGRGLDLAADLYQPATGGSRVPIVLAPGMVELGKDDPRIAPFARLLARAGFTTVVPDLPSFRTLRAHPDNLRDLEAAIEAVAQRPELAPRGAVGLFGISYAGGIALLAALDSTLSVPVPFVATVGAYADLDTSLRFLATGRTFPHGRLRMVKPGPYGQLVFLRTFEEFLSAPRDRAMLEAMAQRRLANPSARLSDLAGSLTPEGRVIYDIFEGGDPERVPGLIAQLPAPLARRMAELSPARRSFDSLRARLYLVHSLDDETFPVTEAYRLRDLARGHTRVRLVVLEELQHVEFKPMERNPWTLATRDLPEAARLAAWWSALLGER